MAMRLFLLFTVYVTFFVVVSPLIAVVVAEGEEGRCATFEGQPNECRAFFKSGSYKFFIPHGYNRSYIEHEAEKPLLLLSIIDDDDCRAAASRLVCATAFQECSRHKIATSPNTSVSVVLPRAPCRSICEDAHSKCKHSDPPVPLPSCNEINDITGVSSYPNSKSVYEFGSGPNGKVKVSVPCNNVTEQPAHKINPVACPKPLKLQDNGRGSPPCVVGCPSFYTDEQWDNLILITSICSWFSFFGLLYLVLTWLSIKERRQFPSNILLLSFVYAAGSALVEVVSSVVGIRSIICVDDFTPATQSDAACGAEGAIIYFFLYAGIVQWISAGVNMFFVVVVGINKATAMKLKWFIYLFPPIFACIMAFGVGLGKHWYVGDFGSTTCDFGVHNQNMREIFFILCCGICLVSVILVAVKLVTTRKDLFKYKYLFLFMAVFFWIFGFSGMTVLYLDHQDEEYVRKFNDYLFCNIEMKEHCDKDYPPADWMIYLNRFNLTSIGTYFFVAFGLQPKVIRHWGRVLMCLYRRDFAELRDMSIKGKRKVNVNVTVGSTQLQVSQKDLLKEQLVF
eukprot:TRINITY_DN943_c0_g1_i1.p1 TRINITY_DN943_c0_g1~~TRINITY_DN943_c0_g1_i1.p1  ORF type:complete len:565 (+),score=99.12 TRINITY_DN943_c0_g1_i1:130-1824(+)